MDLAPDEWTVYLEERSSLGDAGNRRVFGTCPSWEEAVRTAQFVVDRSLNEFRGGNSESAIFDLWSMFGDDAFIEPTGSPGFSGLDYARQQSAEPAATDA